MGILWEKLVRPALFAIDAERAHEMGIAAMRSGLSSLIPASASDNKTLGPIERFGLHFSNPLGLAAGFDKNGVVVEQLAALGFGFVEVGTVTFHPQPGNPKRRLFRLPADKALINRLGFNNDGAAAVAERLSHIKRTCVVGVNIGRNKDVANNAATENYLDCFDAVHAQANYITINISSPNTPNLRDLQRAENLDELLGALQGRNRVLSSRPGLHNRGEVPPDGKTPPPAGETQYRESETDEHVLKPLLVKIAPDLNEGDIGSIVDLCIRHEIAGIIATNTTVSRERLKTREVEAIGPGGLSGLPLRKRSTEVISDIYRHSHGKLPIIGVGGIFTAEDAFEKIAAGASLLQSYTGFIYTGPSFAREVTRRLAAILEERGFASLDEAIGSSLHK